MDALLEAPPRAITFADLAAFSQQLADDVGRLPLRRSGYTVADYLSLDGNYLVEYVDGCIQVLPMPSAVHQALTFVAMQRFDAWTEANDPAARLVQAPFRVYLSPRLYREPDVAVMLGRHADRREANRWDGADLVMEIISESNREHDVTTKRAEYAAAGIPEYWIADPEARGVRVLTLPSGATEYAVHGDFGPGQTATSVVLPGFAVDVSDWFAAGRTPVVTGVGDRARLEAHRAGPCRPGGGTSVPKPGQEPRTEGTPGVSGTDRTRLLREYPPCAAPRANVTRTPRGSPWRSPRTAARATP